jgi:hypothetical protein
VIITLTRDYRDPACTLGVLSAGARSWQTIERPWVPMLGTPAGKKGFSCIPVGTYRLLPHTSEAHPNVWALVSPQLDVYHFDADVPASKVGLARTTVLIHPANWASELEGSVAPGKSRTKTRQIWMVISSRDAINELRNTLGSSIDNQIVITETPTCLPASLCVPLSMPPIPPGFLAAPLVACAQLGLHIHF